MFRQIFESALNIDRSFPNRDLIVILTLGIALFTMLVPGTTIGKLIQKLQLNRSSKNDRLGRALALYIAKESAFEKFNQIKTNDYLFPDVVEKFTQKYQQETRKAKQSAIDLQTDQNFVQDWSSCST